MSATIFSVVVTVIVLALRLRNGDRFDFQA